MGLQSQQLFATNIDIGAVAINIQQLSLVPRPLSVSREKRGGEGGKSGNVTSCDSHVYPGYFLHGY